MAASEGRFCLSGSYQSIYENERKWGKHIQDAERLAEELQKYPCFYEKGNKLYKERDRKENAWGAVEQFLIVFL